MSVIVQQPDSLSFAGNLKKFVVTSAVAVALQLNKGAEQLLNEVYQPGADNIVEIDLRVVIDKVLSVTLPGTNLISEQSSGVADFTATIDGAAVAFRVIKGGVLELGELASVFVDDHFLTWQIQNKTILQHQPEWLTVYTNAGRNLKAKAYYQDNTNASMLLTALAAGKLLAVDVSWASINSLFVKKNPIAWDVWFEDLAGTRLSYVQRYCLRNSDDEEKIFIWANTLGGIDSISLTGSAEDDKKLEHLIAEMGDETLQEYQTDKKREIKQSTGYLTVEESRWIEDFFYSGRRYLVGEDGAVRSIVLASSKIVGSTADDLFDYEFNYRLSSESQLLNLERSFESLPALEVPVDFFLTELLSGLPVAQYADSLLMAVQSPFAQAWQKLSMAQLWGSALPGLVDGSTISVVNGKLQVNGVSGGVGVSKWGDLAEKPFSTLSNLFSVNPEGVLTLANTYALLHTHPYLSDADARIANWNSAFTWGNHATAGYSAAHTHPYRPDTWVPTWAEVSAKPVWTEKFGWDGTAVTIAGDLHVTGKIISDGSMQFYGISSGGTGGGGASALWQLTDVADEMEFSINGDIPLYNGTHFTRYNISNLSQYGHLHSIAQVTGLQAVLDGKQPLLGYTPYYASNFVAGVNYSAPHSHPYLSDVDARIANWNTAFTWGNHAGLYRPIGWVPSWGEITAKPIWTEKMGWDGTAVTIAGDLHVTGKIISDGSMQFYGISSGGTGGGGASALWQLTDVADEMEFSVNGDIPLYNGTHFARYNISNLSLYGHLHSIAQVTGLQAALDGKQSLLGYTPYYSANFVVGVNYSAPHSHPYLSDADARIANWNTAFTWGNHATAGYALVHTHPYRPDTWVPSWADVSVKPTWTEKVGWDGSAVTIAGDLHVTGKIISDGSMQFYGISSGGSGGGGSTTLWGLSDVSDDVANAVNGDLIMYNGTHFARINQSVLAPAVHSHAIGQVTGLQGALDGKQASGSYVLTSDGRLSDSRVASDVYTWAKAASKPSYTKAEVGLSLVDNTADASKSVAYAASSGLLLGRSDYSLTNHTHNILYSKYNYESGFTIPETTTAIILSEPSQLNVAMMSLTSTDGVRIFGSYANVLNYSGYQKYGSTQIGVRYDGSNGTHKIAFRNFNQVLNGYNNWCEIWNTDNLNRSDVPLFGSTGYFESSVRASHFIGSSIRNNAEIAFATIDGGSYQSIRALNYYGLGSLAVLGTGYFEGKLTVQVPAGGVSASFTDNTYSTLKIKHPSLGVTQLINGYDVAWLTENAGNATFSGSVTSAGQITSVNGNSGQWNAAFSHSVRIDNPHVVTATQVGLGNVTNESKMTMFTNPVFTGSVTAPIFYGALSGNATTASSTQQLTPLGQYVWNASSLPQSFNTGIQCSFVSGTEGFPSFGSVLNMAAYGGGGSAMQMFVPYSPSYGGYSLKVRFGNYDVNIGNSWTDWKTLLYNGYPEAVTFGSNLIVSGTIRFYTASDRRLKTDFETITNPIEKIKSLTGYFFNYTDQAMTLGGYTSRRDIGLIAQDVHAILPEATGKLWGSDFMGYKADKLIPLLVEAIKQQQTEIDQLKRQIAA